LSLAQQGCSPFFPLKNKAGAGIERGRGGTVAGRAIAFAVR